MINMANKPKLNFVVIHEIAPVVLASLPVISIGSLPIRKSTGNIHCDAASNGFAHDGAHLNACSSNG